MPRILPPSLIAEKNKIATPSAWLLLLDITLPNTTMFFLTNNNEDVSWETQLYTAVPLQIEPSKESVSGNIPTFNIMVNNVTRIMQGYIEEADGAVGSTVLMRVVSTVGGSVVDDVFTLAGGVDYTELEMVFEVVATYTDTMWVTFTLGAPNPLRKRFPLGHYLPDNCEWLNRYMGAECAYGGELPTCAGTYSACVLHSNQTRFGGFKGLGSGGLRVIR